MEATKKLTPLEEKWEKNKLSEDSTPKKATLDDAYTEEGKVANEGLADKILVAQKPLKAELCWLMRPAKELNWLPMWATCLKWALWRMQTNQSSRMGLGVIRAIG